VSTAATLIESWTRQEIAESELPPEPPRAVAAVPVAPRAAPEEVVASAKPRAAAPPFALGLGAESSFAGDGTTWGGGAVSACVRFGAFCAGGRARIAGDLRITSDTGHPRLGADLAATLEVVLRPGGFVVAPAAGLGVAWTRVSGGGLHMDETAEAGGVRASLGASLARPIAGRLAIALDATFELTLFGSGGLVGADDGFAPGGWFRVGLGVRWGWR
jgi:hypothetical protein